MTDLNSLVSPGSSLYFMLGESINARGEITGIAFDQNAGAIPLTWRSRQTVAVLIQPQSSSCLRSFAIDFSSEWEPSLTRGRPERANERLKLLDDQYNC